MENQQDNNNGTPSEATAKRKVYEVLSWEDHSYITYVEADSAEQAEDAVLTINRKPRQVDCTGSGVADTKETNMTVDDLDPEMVFLTH